MLKRFYHAFYALYLAWYLQLSHNYHPVSEYVYRGFYRVARPDPAVKIGRFRYGYGGSK
jgi:hypothetical protein